MTKDKSIFIKNIYYMLSYAFTALPQGEYESVAAEKFENIHDLFAAILAKGIARQLKQGLYREYRDRTEDLAAVRGKIELRGTLQNRWAKKQRLTCEFDELTENNLLNRILKTTVLLLLRQPDVKMDRKIALKQEMLLFSAVDVLEPARIPWNHIQFQRSSNSYQLLIGLCRLVLEGMLLTTEEGEYRLASFFDKQHMEHLYEKFILEYYVKEYPHIRARASTIAWALDEGTAALLPAMQSDIMLSRGSRVLIIDAKYYTHTLQTHYENQSVHSANLYQIFTYVKNKDAEFGSTPHCVAGMLLYAKTEEDSQPDVSVPMSGNTISVKTLDLNQEFTAIAAQLNAIADGFFATE